MNGRPGADSRTPAFGDLLRSFRLRAGFSQEQLAERANVSPKSIGAIEQGIRRSPYRQTVELLATALALSKTDRVALERAAARPRASPPANGVPDELEHNFPRSLTPFVERDDVGAIVELLGGHRLVTISGAGGLGKTRTIVEAARRFARAEQRPVWFVDLSAIGNGSRIVEQIAAALKLTIEPHESYAALAEALATSDLTIILDNCEHVVTEAALAVAAILESCPFISVIVTSREILGLASETVYRLPALRLPQTPVESIDDARLFSAVALFLQRAQYADVRLTPEAAQLPAIIDICRRLDGIPLAIELAAARLPAIGIETLQRRLNDAFVLTGGPDLPPRQQTMTAAIAWSFDLLSPAEQLLLERTGVFVSGFRLEAAEHVCADDDVPKSHVLDLLDRLAEKSLINIVSVSDAPRYTLLETIRSFGLKRLLAQNRHAVYALRLAEWLAREGDAVSGYILGAPSMTADFDNVRAAVTWCLDSGDQTLIVLAARIISGLRRGWELVGRSMELRRHVDAVLAKLDDVEANYVIIARLWRARLNTYGSYSPALIEQAIAIFERAGEEEAAAILHAQGATAFAGSGRYEQANRHLADAARYYEANGERRRGKLYNTFICMSAWVHFAQGMLDEARAELIALGDSPGYEGDAEDEGSRYNTLAEIEFHSGHVDAAIALCDRSLGFYGHESIGAAAATVLANMSCFQLASGDLDAAERYGLRGLQSYVENGFPRDQLAMSIPFQHLAAVNALRGNLVLAATILGFVDAHWADRLIVLPATTQRSRDILLTTLERGLSDGECARLRTEGAELDAESIYDLVLHPTP